MKQNVLKRLGRTAAMMSVFLLVMHQAQALEYVSVAEHSAILYDAPSLKGKKLFVISRYTPLEKVVNLERWIKVRDSSGTMAWIERRVVSERRYVVVKAAVGTVRQAPELNATVAFQVSQNVALESLGINGGGWIKARHQDGSSGYIRSIEVWGAD
ncbi:MAG: hypothetical protein B7Y56_02045 [Gallionellales bacterium 35-53-114]|jgi:SH3-like domain-containing protein|nr:MAG: hypothetical protein B7Y56_02045 [Gallionellales bacterium 35-53-114]OYZ64402.1 MAG: hypothetical protein B7Y04_05825 [Gallionellales bacterium 24-53-125]OZB10290.1 MAG: hypothetical protein B7X61_01880 [Gallionellales bacterium 39-52-133]HQS56887.1 SH3 domain-containing protein [Gallionellaceae bacterium]HQS75329.1 SH3 domain-containing protein [Gallionellaceae bacterium]